jgi:hypothetical protein
MKWHAQPVAWTGRTWSDDDVFVDENRLVGKETSAAVWGKCQSVACQREASGSLSTPMRIVGVLAFCQAVFFLVLFLFICARAGAATEGKTVPSLELNLSTYAAQTQRDPFGSEAPKSGGTGAKAAPSTGIESFKLMGILYDAANPAALVNSQLVDLKKPVKVQTDQGEVEVKALTITRDTVLLEVGGQKMELRLGGTERDKGSK